MIPWNSQFTPEFKDMDFFVIKYLNCHKTELKQLLNNAISILKNNGFITVLLRTKLILSEMFISAVGETVIPIQTETDIEKMFKELNLKVICKKSDSIASTLYLLRKTPDTCYKEVIIPIFNHKYEKWVNLLKEEMLQYESSSESKRIWLVSETSASNGVVGLINCLRQEPMGPNIRCVFTSKEANLTPFSFENPLYSSIRQKDLIMNVFKEGSWGSYRHITAKEGHTKNQTTHAYLNILTRGDLSSLVWVDAPFKYFSESKKSVLCQVYYAPLNFRDIMLASGKLPPDAIPGDLALQDCILGLEFSGRLENGKRVMGLVPAKGLATTVAADPNFIWDVPNSWSLEEASTIPVAYSTAYYALIIRGNLRRGDKVLIHSGSGGVGQAAIAIALSVGCEVFTSVGTTEKKIFLKKRFKALQDRHFCNSRDTSFEHHILDITDGEGVDVILNSLAEEKLKATLNCLAQHGRFLEIGKYDLSVNSPLGMAIFLKNISFHGILLDALFEGKSYSSRVKNEVVQLVKDGIANQTVKPLPFIIYTHEQAEQAFRFMASGKHIGKVVLKIRNEEAKKEATPSPIKVSSISRTIFNPHKSYIIIGGLGGFGLELCQWMTEKGARNIILTSRTGVRSGYQHLCMQRWKQEGVNVVVSDFNVCKQDEAKSLFNMANKDGQVGGIFNLALVLRDAFMENQSIENFKEVGESKIISTQNLDILSRKLCPQLDYFVCFSSVSCGRGVAGQSNYGFANSAMERICEKRCREGLPGLAIQWGAVGDVGVIQETVGSDVVIGGTIPQRVQSCLSVLDEFLQQSHPVMSSFVPYKPLESVSKKNGKTNVLSTIANIFGIKNITSISPETTLGELGLDSLMGVETKQFLERDLDLVFSIPELRQLQIKDLKSMESNSSDLESSCFTKNTNSENTNDSNLEKPNFQPFFQFTWNTMKQLVPTQTIVHLNSIETGIPLFVIHPIEGSTGMLESLAHNLQCPVYGIQSTRETLCDSIESLAAWYWKKIGIVKLGSSINIAGYSFGASVAFEMALQAESNGKLQVKNVILLDGCPALVTIYAKYYQEDFLLNSTTKGVQMLSWFTMQFVELNITELKKELLKFSQFDERVKYAALKITTAHSHLQLEEIVSAFNLYYNKVQMSLQYKPQKTLTKDIILIKASESVEVTKTLSDQYDLEKVCNGKITVQTVQGTHQTFIQEKGAKEVSKLLNSIFSRGH